MAVVRALTARQLNHAPRAASRGVPVGGTATQFKGGVNMNAVRYGRPWVIMGWDGMAPSRAPSSTQTHHAIACCNMKRKGNRTLSIVADGRVSTGTKQRRNPAHGHGMVW